MGVLSSLIHEPSLIMDDHYPLCPDDFPERFHRIIFAALDSLAHSGVKEFDEVVIDNYLSKYPKQYTVFEQNDGMQYIINICDSFYQPQNFDHNYNSLRKCSVLNRLATEGYDISRYYDANALTSEEIGQIRKTFDEASIDTILSSYEGQLMGIKACYCSETERKGVQAAQGMKQLKEQLKQSPEMGMPMNSAKLTTICRGRRLKKFYFKIAPSGVGKSRISMGDAILPSVPEWWDLTQKCWVKTGYNQPTLFISTELEIDEAQTLIMAYVSGVPEDHILDGVYLDADEEIRVDHAIEIINNSPLFIEYMPDFNIDDIEAVVKEYKLKHNIGYVFFDYLTTSMKLLMEIATKARGINLREDNVLMMFSTRLSLLAKKLNVHIDSSAQANGEWKTMKDPDQNLTRGAKGISDKVDVGYCVLPPTEKDMEAYKRIQGASGTHFLKQPNLIYHIYKVRRGRLNHVKLFVDFDYSTMRTTDLLVTDKDYKPLKVDGTNIELILNQTEIREKEKDFDDEVPFII